MENEMNDGNDIKDGKEKMEILCYTVPAVHSKWDEVICNGFGCLLKNYIANLMGQKRNCKVN